MPLTITYPLVNDDVKNFLFKTDSETKEALRSKLLFLLTTEEGTRYKNRNFGVNLIRYIFEPNDNVTKTDVVEDIKDKVRTYIPKLSILDIEFIQPENDNTKNIASVRIFFQYSIDSTGDDVTINFTI